MPNGKIGESEEMSEPGDVGIEISQELYDRLKALADERGVGMKELVTGLLDDYDKSLKILCANCGKVEVDDEDITLTFARSTVGHPARVTGKVCQQCYLYLKDDPTTRRRRG